MIFNEILIPRDSFTETNVTRKMVRRRKFTSTLNRLKLFKIYLMLLYAERKWG